MLDEPIINLRPVVVPYTWITPLVPNSDPSTLSAADTDPDAVPRV